MAEDDLDLEDDDLDLGGDDFAGELDDMMGDDELGGDSGGGGGGGGDDSELDSFFEDLSSIEDMDEGGSDPSPAAAVAATPQSKEEAAPAKVKPVKTKEKKKGGKLKYFILLLIIIGGAGFYFKDLWLPFTQMAEEEMFPPEESLTEQTIQFQRPVVQPKPVKPPPVLQVEPLPAPVPVPVKPAAPKRRYLVQVATCTYDVCKEDFTESLRRTGEPVFQRSSGEKYDFIELVSSQVFTFRDASQFANEINIKNKLAGKASVKSQSNGYRITMGSFPALDRAKEIKDSIEKIFPGKNVTFNLEHVRKDYTTTKIFAGPYGSNSEARSKMAKLRSQEKFSGAFVVRY